MLTLELLGALSLRDETRPVPVAAQQTRSCAPARARVGDWPRNFSLDPSGRWLLVANQRSDSVALFGRDPENGRLTPTRQRIALPSPVCLRFLAPRLPH